MGEQSPVQHDEDIVCSIKKGETMAANMRRERRSTSPVCVDQSEVSGSRSFPSSTVIFTFGVREIAFPATLESVKKKKHPLRLTTSA